MDRGWLAILLLICTFSSHPMGSAEQRVWDSATSRSALQAVAVARPSGETAALVLIACSGTPGSSHVTFPPVPPLAAGRFLDPFIRSEPQAYPAQLAVGLPSLLERLPYDATAPPAAV